jgi:hypothetical protein
MTNKEFTKKEMLEYNKLYEANSKKASKLLSAINKKNKADKEFINLNY